MQNTLSKGKSFQKFIVKNHKQTVAMVSGLETAENPFSFETVFCTPKATALLFINFNF